MEKDSVYDDSIIREEISSDDEENQIGAFECSRSLNQMKTSFIMKESQKQGFILASRLDESIKISQNPVKINIDETYLEIISHENYLENMEI